MNTNDAEVLNRILTNSGYTHTSNLADAQVVLLITCAVRDNAEAKVWRRLEQLQATRRKGTKIGLLGCMAERLKMKLLEGDRLVDVVCGPDAYRSLPDLLAQVEEEGDEGLGAANVQLSVDETYAVSSILDEVRYLRDQGIKEVTLLGQNVNSYRDTSSVSVALSTGRGASLSSPDFKTVYRQKEGGLRFTDLMDQVSQIDPDMRIRFTSPHPKDFPKELLDVIRERPNVCKQIHIPAQSGNSVVLERMRRGYTMEAYLELVQRMREMVPGVSLSSDFIVGFCGETEAEFQDTLSMVDIVGYEMAYMFHYSLREKTKAHRTLKDDIPPTTKTTRLNTLISTFRARLPAALSPRLHTPHLVLVTGRSRRSARDWHGRNDGGQRVVIRGEGEDGKVVVP
ncbi:hypothetical protein HK104_004156, partial [Borealophlyctis nickersoniae]